MNMLQLDTQRLGKRLTGAAGLVVVTVAVVLLFGGCSTVDTTTGTTADVAAQIATFIEDFARQVLAAYVL
jgi:hypothetical protein